jgi:hypothetical protein
MWARAPPFGAVVKAHAGGPPRPERALGRRVPWATCPAVPLGSRLFQQTQDLGVQGASVLLGEGAQPGVEIVGHPNL